MRHEPSDNDYLTIKEFSVLVDISPPTLRHYDNEGIFMAARRGNANDNNYRQYLPPQITTVNFIRVLRNIGVQLKAIKRLAAHRTPEIMLKILTKQRNHVEKQLHILNEAHSVVNVYIDLLINGLSCTENEIAAIEMPNLRMVMGKPHTIINPDIKYHEFISFCHEARIENMNQAFPVGGLFEDMEALINSPYKPTRFFSLDPNGRDNKKAGLHIVCYTRGNYGEVKDVPKKMMKYAKDNGLAFIGPVYVIFVFDEVSINDKNKYLMQISAPVVESNLNSFYHQSTLI